MKKLMVGIMVMVLTFGLASMTLAEEDEGIGFNFTTKYHPSGWIDAVGWRTPRSMFLTEVSQDLPHGFYAYIWNLTGLEESGADETDYNVGKTGEFSLADVVLNYDIGFGYWDLRNRFSSGGPQTDYWNFWAEFGHEFQPVKNLNFLSYVRLEYLEPVQSNGEFSEGGFFTALGLRQEWEVGKIIFPLTIETDARVVYDSGLYGGETAFIGRLTIQASWQVKEHLAFIFGADSSQPLAGNLEDGRGTELVAWAGISLSI